MAYKAQEFLDILKPYVIEDMRKSGILASLTAAQAFIESNKGNSGLTTKANNLFGMKGQYNGQSVDMKTKEFVNGGYITIIAKFRKYPSWAESIADHSALFNRLSRYSNLRGLRDYELACKFVRQDGYATAPDYTRTLITTIERYKLYEWDKEALNGNIDMSSNNPYREPVSNIKKGMCGNAIKWIQYQLNQHGAKLVIDGIYGERTFEAVADFQADHFDASGNPLVIDGIVGPKTREALK